MVILRSFDAFPIFDNLESQNDLIKLWASCEIIYCLHGTLAAKCSSSFWGHSVHFWLLTATYLENGAWCSKEGVKVKIRYLVTHIWVSWTLIVVFEGRFLGDPCKLVSKMNCNLKMACHGLKINDIWDPGTLVQNIWGAISISDSI